MPSRKSPELKNICRIDIAARGGKHETHGWQFKAMREGKQQTKFFADGIFGSIGAARDAAIQYRDRTLDEIGDYTGFFIADTLPVSNTSGILGVHRSESIRQDESIEEVWQASTPAAVGRPRFRAFRISTYGEKGALYKAVEERLEGVADLIGVSKYKPSASAISRLIDIYLNILIYIESADVSETEYLISIINSRTIGSTEKHQIITGRVGQASFRDKLNKLWQGKCAVTGASVLLNASHIKPWAVASDQERLDPFNGFLLSPVYDKAFDQGLISFEDSGQIMISGQLAGNIRQLNLDPSAHVKRINPISFPYLGFHRQNVYKK